MSCSRVAPLHLRLLRLAPAFRRRKPRPSAPGLIALAYRVGALDDV